MVWAVGTGHGGLGAVTFNERARHARARIARGAERWRRRHGTQAECECSDAAAARWPSSVWRGRAWDQGAREGGCERTSVRSECQSLLGYVSPCGEEPVAAAAISARLPACVLCAQMRFAPCVVRAFFYAFMYRGVSIDSKQRPSTAPCLRDPSQTCGCACGDRSDGHVHRHVPDAARHAQAPARTSGPLPAQRTPRHLPPPAAARLCRHQAAPQRRSSGSVRAQHALIMRPPTGAQPRNDRLLCAHDMEGNALIYMYIHTYIPMYGYYLRVCTDTHERTDLLKLLRHADDACRVSTPRREPTRAGSLLSLVLVCSL